MPRVFTPDDNRRARARRLLASAVAAIVAAVALGSCGGGEADDLAHRNVFFYNESDPMPSLDPVRINARAAWWVGEQIYLGLVGLDTDLRVVPRLASRWDISDDGLLWTFHLRSDVRFADDAAFPGGVGRTVTASDVRYSFERVVNPATASSGAWLFLGKVKGAKEFYEARRDGAADLPEHVSGFRVVDDTTFVVELERPFPPFLSTISMPYGYIVPHEAVEHYGKEFFRNPVGAGAFRLSSWDEGQQMVLARNPNYYERDAQGTQLPYLDSVEISFIRDHSTEFTEFEQGRLDALSFIDAKHAEAVFTSDGTALTPGYSKYHLYSSPGMSVEYYGFTLGKGTDGAKNSPFVGNARLRRAINYAIDRRKIIDFVMRGRATPGVYGPIPPATPGAEKVDGYHYDPDLARRLLDSAGYPNGHGLPPITLTLTSDERISSIAEAVQAQLKSIGIDVRLDPLSGAQQRQLRDEGRLMFWRANWMADYPHPENFLALFYSPYAAPQGPNYTRYSNPVVDSLYRAALDPSLDEATRASMYAQAQRVILDDAPWVILYYSLVQRLTQPWVAGYAVDPLDRLELTRVRKTSN